MTKKRSTDIRTCPVCGHTVQRSDMQFTRDCNGIPFRLVCWDCYDQLMAKGFVDEYWKWVKENGDNEIGHLMRDFLSEVKGYCLIHNPTGCGGYIVTNMKSLTKRQKEFLYGYFMDMGDRFKAEQFIKE